jgi:hypothetical protein
MEWSTVLLVFLLIVFVVVLGLLLSCMLAGQRCTVSFQQRTPNHELTQIQQEQERRKQKKLGSRLKRAFRSSSKSLPTPAAPVEDVKTVEFTFKLGEKNMDTTEQVTAKNEPTVALLPKLHVTEAELAERQRKRDEMRKKYNL